MATASKSDIKSLQFSELQEKLRQLDEPSYRAEQITDWLYKKRVASINDMTDLPRHLREKLAIEFCSHQSETVRVLGSQDDDVSRELFLSERRNAACEFE